MRCVAPLATADFGAEHAHGTLAVMFFFPFHLHSSFTSSGGPEKVRCGNGRLVDSADAMAKADSLDTLIESIQ